MKAGIGALALVLIAALIGLPAAAASFCERLDALHPETSEPDQSFALPEQNAHVAGCLVALNTQGARSLHCMWKFDYRSDAAGRAFETLLEKVETCGSEAARKDQNVNHPDFYDLRLFKIGQREVGVSIKDKGALQQTLVFLIVSDG